MSKSPKKDHSSKRDANLSAHGTQESVCQDPSKPDEVTIYVFLTDSIRKCAAKLEKTYKTIFEDPILPLLYARPIILEVETSEWEKVNAGLKEWGRILTLNRPEAFTHYYERVKMYAFYIRGLEAAGELEHQGRISANFSFEPIVESDVGQAEFKSKYPVDPLCSPLPLHREANHAQKLIVVFLHLYFPYALNEFVLGIRRTRNAYYSLQKPDWDMVVSFREIFNAMRIGSVTRLGASKHEETHLMAAHNRLIEFVSMLEAESSDTFSHILVISGTPGNVEFRLDGKMITARLSTTEKQTLLAFAILGNNFSTNDFEDLVKTEMQNLAQHVQNKIYRLKLIDGLFTHLVYKATTKRLSGIRFLEMPPVECLKSMLDASRNGSLPKDE